ncbi:type I restriction endonuclease subunit R [Desulfobacterales bacterium HSG17]|nr:type I restriction endonuclease subunit R [Desulfobacterales bacterium HSG17]
MLKGPEHTLVEMPSIKILQTLGYDYLKPAQNETARDGLNNVILRDIFTDALIRINSIDQNTATLIYHEFLSISDNEKWLSILRGDYSRKVPGQTKNKTIRTIDFLNPENNTFTVTNQFKVHAQKNRIPDMVCFINGIPVIVVEAKTPVNFKNKTGQAFDQIKGYEKDIPRLFYSNIFNIITDSITLMYGTTGAQSQYWGYWRDPWEKIDDDFIGELNKGYYCLLKPSRLLDIIAHFIVFEKNDNQVVKKICRYQQFRAVNKIVQKLLENRHPGHRQGLIWHTQGSGKSLTMVFAVLKLKKHLTIQSEVLSSPNILVLTDRIDLDEQISKTFKACGLPNPLHIETQTQLMEHIHAGTSGKTLLSTIFKFENSKQTVENSENWIILVDECHRTQEKDLGAYLRKTFPESWFFGFTGTPVKKTDKDTYRNFSPPGEAYLDKYSIDDAVADGATVPIFYTSRLVKFHVDTKTLDIKFDQAFAHLTEKQKTEIQKKDLKFKNILKHWDRVESIATDIWEHFKNSAKKDGYKAQIVAIDREGVILYKRALDKVIAKDFEKQGMSLDKAQAEAAACSVPVYSANRKDGDPSEDEYTNSIRKDLIKYRLDENNSKSENPEKRISEKRIKEEFKKKNQPPWFLIVCSKLLTGFDAPAESVMYLDNPLKEHNLLQAIARTNRIEDANKPHGLIVDYVGVTENLAEALASYRSKDVQNAMINLDALRSELRQAHRDVMAMMKNIKRQSTHFTKNDYIPEFDALIKALESLDQWYEFKRLAGKFISVYQALCPDPDVLEYKRDMKWISMFLSFGTQKFEQSESVNIQNCSAKIREILEEELRVTGLGDMIKLRSLEDEDFWDDFSTTGKNKEQIEQAAVKKATELKKSLSEKLDTNPEQYHPFSDRLIAIINRLNKGLASAADTLKDMEQLSKDLIEESNAHKKPGLTQTAYGIYKILEAFHQKKAENQPKDKSDKQISEKPAKPYERKLSPLQQAAAQIDNIYTSEQTAPKGWHLKEQMKKDQRSMVRRIVLTLKIKNWKEIPEKVETFAIRHYVQER